MVGSKIHWLDRQDPTRNCTWSALHALLPPLPVLPGLPWCCKDNLAQACIRHKHVSCEVSCDSMQVNAFHPQGHTREVC